MFSTSAPLSGRAHPAQRMTVPPAMKRADAVTCSSGLSAPPGFVLPDHALELALEEAQLGYCVLDVRTRRTIRNLRHDQVFGYPVMLPEPTCDVFLNHVDHPGERSAMAAAFSTTEGNAHRVFECRITRADGRPAWISGRVRVVCGDDGAPSWLIGVVEDATARNQRETTLLDATREKEQLLATVAHELRQPLGPVVAALEVLRRHINPAADERALGVIDRQANVMKRLIDDLLDASRLTNRKMELRKQRIDARRVVMDAAESIRPLMDQQRHRFGVNLPSDPAWLSADVDRMQQVLSNLLRNAALYTEVGGDTSITLAVLSATLTITVKDSGKGIAAEMLPHIFTTFGPAVEGNHGGLGIGLNLARGLVALHGGTLTAHSAGVNQGSEFVVTLHRDD